MLRFRFPVVIIDEDFRSENTSGLGIRALASAIEKEGIEVLGVTSYGDLSQFAQQQSPRVGVHPVDRRRGVHARSRARSRPSSTCARSSRRSGLQERGHPDLHLRRDAHVAAHPQRHPEASCTASSTCSRTRRSSWRVTSSARPTVYLDGVAPPFFKRADPLRAGRLVLVALPGPLRRRRVPEEPGRARCSTSSSARTCCAPTSATRSRSSASCSTTPARWRTPSATRRASSTRTTATSSPTARRRRTRSCGTRARSRPTTSWWSTATATSRSCTRSSMCGAIPVFLTPKRNHYGIIGPIPKDGVHAREPSRGRSPPTRCSPASNPKNKSSRAS